MKLGITMLVLAGCGGTPFLAEPDILAEALADGGDPVVDSGTVAVDSGSSAVDSGKADSGTVDSSAVDSGVVDSGVVDSGSGTIDTGVGVDSGDDSGCNYLHHNGLGQTWTDCIPTGTHTAAQALKACIAAVGSAQGCAQGGFCDRIDGPEPWGTWGWGNVPACAIWIDDSLHDDLEAGDIVGSVGTGGCICPTNFDGRWD
jgi:hypothetical protein